MKGPTPLDPLGFGPLPNEVIEGTVTEEQMIDLIEARKEKINNLLLDKFRQDKKRLGDKPKNDIVKTAVRRMAEVDHVLRMVGITEEQQTPELIMFINRTIKDHGFKKAYNAAWRYIDSL